MSQKVTITFEIERHPDVTDDDFNKLREKVIEDAPAWYEMAEEDFLANKYTKQANNEQH